jgi:hypothetical protein
VNRRAGGNSGHYCPDPLLPSWYAPQMLGNNKNWEELYQQAVLELDFQKIVATGDAIAGRLRDLENDSDHHSERHRIEDALLALTIFEHDIKEG